MQTNKVLLRQLAIEHQGNAQEYQLFKKTIQASPYLYKNDFDFYNDTVSQRHIRHIAEIKYIQKLIKDKILQPSMLKHNVYNTFYPSYILHHHYNIFTPLLKKLPKNEAILNLKKMSKKNQITGAFLQQTRKVDLSPLTQQIPLIDQNGIIKMKQISYFYSLVSSPYITHAAFLAQQDNIPVFVIVQVRNNQGQFAKGVKVFDFGQILNKDYLPVGYNFSGLKPLLMVPLQSKLIKNFGLTPLRQYLQDFMFSLKDLQKSLWVTLKYTGMRKQFRSIDNSKEERPIRTYQAVATRIINGFSLFQAFSDLYARMITNKQSALVFGELLQSSHHVMLEYMIHLRECCGGFGYLQFSGHPGCIERVCNRAGRQPEKHLKTSQKFLRATQFFSGDKETQQYFSQDITNPDIHYLQFLSFFFSIVKNMRNNKEKMTPQEYRREYLKQASIMAMHAREEQLTHQAQNIHCQLLIYLLFSYILKNTKFGNWDAVKIDRKLFFSALTSGISQALENIIGKIDDLEPALEVDHLRNTIIGRQKSQDFYQELLKTSKANSRNSKEYTDYIRAPIVTMLAQNRATL